MADPAEEWSTDSNRALHISLVTAANDKPRTIHTFHPKMTYSIFGDEERIFGYQGLKINLKFNASDMRPSVQILYAKKFKAVGDTEPEDVKAILEDFLPKTAFETQKVFEKTIADPILADWTPPGELWQSFEANGTSYEVWQGNLADLAVQQVVKRMQILVPLFIDGGSLIDFTDTSLDRWTVFFLYQKKKAEDTDKGTSPYVFMGYSTVYKYFYFHADKSYAFKGRDKQPTEAYLDFEITPTEDGPNNFKCRSRISQFIILPPFHGGGNGSRLYNSIFEFLHKDPATLEITVEDPNEAFDDMRDLNDLARLRKALEFVNTVINTKVTLRSKGNTPNNIIDLEALEKIRLDAKIAPRQFYRVAEMQALSKIPEGVRQSLIARPAEKIPDLKLRQHEYRLWQLWVKKRLYKHNKDMLMQLDRAERIEKLEQALGGVEADYARLLRTLDERRNGISTSKKRASPGDEQSGSEDDVPAAKKIKFT